MERSTSQLISDIDPNGSCVYHQPTSEMADGEHHPITRLTAEIIPSNASLDNEMAVEVSTLDGPSGLSIGENTCL